MWDLRIANEVDQVVVFQGGFKDFTENCFAGRKPGPFCRQNQISDETIERIETAISRGFINSNKFVTIVYGVPKFKLSKVFKQIEKSISSSLYIANESEEISKDLTMSTSWEQLGLVLRFNDNVSIIRHNLYALICCNNVYNRRAIKKARDRKRKNLKTPKLENS